MGGDVDIVLFLLNLTKAYMYSSAEAMTVPILSKTCEVTITPLLFIRCRRGTYHGDSDLQLETWGHFITTFSLYKVLKFAVFGVPKGT